jgi:hypothetical protein
MTATAARVLGWRSTAPGVIPRDMINAARDLAVAAMRAAGETVPDSPARAEFLREVEALRVELAESDEFRPGRAVRAALDRLRQDIGFMTRPGHGRRSRWRCGWWAGRHPERSPCLRRIDPGDVDAIASGVLGRVQGVVGLVQDLVGAEHVPTGTLNADARGRGDFPAGRRTREPMRCRPLGVSSARAGFRQHTTNSSPPKRAILRLRGRVSSRLRASAQALSPARCRSRR